MNLFKEISPRIIISGGGTGGHLFPALAIAEAIKKIVPNVEFLFVGALGKLEMEKVPLQGYKIIGLDIRGFQRSFSFKNMVENLKFPFRLVKSYLKAYSIIRSFKPQVAVGVGGYASGPLLLAAGQYKIPTLIQEQNSYPGKTNLFLGKKARKICVAYPDMDRFFEASKIILTGNPVREEVIGQTRDKIKACQSLGLDPEKPVVLVLGGSGGAKNLNEGMLSALSLLESSEVQIIWQTGKAYYDTVQDRVNQYLQGRIMKKWKLFPFLDNMGEVYSASDLVISRAGAGTISELSLVGKPCILVPSPNVAEDHQTKNALSLVAVNAAILVRDRDAKQYLVAKILEVIAQPALLEDLSRNISLRAYPHAAERIAEWVLNLALEERPLKKVIR